MNIKTALLVVALALGVSFISTQVFSSTGASSGNQAAAVAALLDNGEIRAAYIPYPPYFIKDPNTGELSGIGHDIIEEAAKNLGLSVNWSEEATWATFPEGLEAGRYDVVGSGIWANSQRARVVDFTIPVFYAGIGVYVRADDPRFGNTSRVNSEDITIVAIDGEVNASIAKETFPRANVISLPQDTPVTSMILQVITRKADVVFLEVEVGEDYIRNNPGTLRNIAKEKPVRIFPTTFAIAQNQPVFKSMLDTALQELINTGAIDRIIKKYEKYPRTAYPIAPPYAAP